ncbi:Retrotransposon gag domain [Sesbania bispinosa]|nr:Retrotransposon gag domain [Sesbania bispinosa]
MVHTRMEARLDNLEKGFDARIDNLEVRFNNMERGFEDRFNNMEKGFKDMFCNLERGFENILEMLLNINQKLQQGGNSSGDSGNSVEGNLGGQNGTRNGAMEERWRKLDIPLFSGYDAYGWVNRVERYFNLKGVMEQERLQVVMVAMEGRALTWFQWWEFCTVNRTWEGFRTVVIRKFQPSMAQNPYKLLLGLKQTTSVEEYREKFELYAGLLKEVDPEYLKGIFLNGLKEVVRAELRIVMWEAGSRNQAQVEKGGAISTVESNSVKMVGPHKGKGFKKLTDAEFQEKSRKGLCFRCDEKFGPGHVCKNKQLHVLILNEECMEEEEEEEGHDSQNGEDLENKVLQLSMYIITGLTSKKSIKMWGEIHGERVTVLYSRGWRWKKN